MKLRHSFLILFIVATISANGQYTKEFKRIFFDAEYLYETEFYEEAFNRYKNLLTLDPGNHNILFLCGACCLNIPGDEEQAIPYLKEAVEGVTPDYKISSHKETGAPNLAYFYLGKAYHLQYEFDKAIENYEKYLELEEGEDQTQLAYVQQQIEACERGAKLNWEVTSFGFQNVLDYFDDELPSCNNPVISGDGNILIFLVDYPADKKIMMTTRADNLWSRPRVINSDLGMVGETYPVCLSYDGKELYLVHKFYSHSDIFVSRFEEGQWSEAKALGYQINGRTSETHASVSKDGKTLYFTSNARGGYGSFDIYRSRLDEKGSWGTPVNLGPVINTQFEEHTPFISGNDSVLFFSSQGHATIGGNDVFFSKLKMDGTWSEPERMKYPVNTTGDDLFFNPGWNERDGYYAMRKEDDPSSNSINMVMELEPEEQVAVVEPADSIHDELTLAVVIEPPNTDEIEEVLNQGAIQPEEPLVTQVEPPAETEPETKPRPEPVPVPVPVPVPQDTTTPALPSELWTMIPFDYNQYDLNLAGLLESERIAELVAGHPGMEIEITGHTDGLGSSHYNMLLSLKRADRVARYLESRGVDRERIHVEGKGEDDPAAKNRYQDGSDAPLGRYVNREVVVRITGDIPAGAELAGFYVPTHLKPGIDQISSTEKKKYWYTIQVRAGFEPANMVLFSNLENVREYKCADGYYRNVTEQFETFREARERLITIQNMGYSDAFVQTLDSLTAPVK